MTLTVDAAVTLAIQLLFGLIFVGVLVRYVRRRDPLDRDLVAVFGSVAALFALQLSALVFGATPAPLSAIGSALLLAQPVLTLRLVAHLRNVPRAVMWAAAVGYVATALPLVLIPSPRPLPITLAAVGVFAVTELLAAWYLAREAARRAGAGRVRLALAALATGLFAGAILSAGAGAAGAGPAGAWLARLIALVAAVGYALAFLPPAPLRRYFAAATAYRASADILGSSAGGAAAVWATYADLACEITGADAALVVGPGSEDGLMALATSRLPDTGDSISLPAEASAALLADVSATEQPVMAVSAPVRQLAGRIGARFVIVVPCPEPAAALVVLARHRNLFGDDDRDLLARLGAQAAVLAARAELVERLAEANAALRAADAAKSDFVASMSHELRTPLNAILGFSQLMLRVPTDAEDPATVREYAGHVHGAGEHLLELINDVLDLAKIEAGRFDLRLTLVDLRSIAVQMIETLRPLAERKRLRLELVPGEAVVVAADAGRIRQVVVNLLSNAIKFTPDEGEVRVEVGADAGFARLVVADSGPGIAPEDQPRVFEAFRQLATGDAAHQEGTGLGLALARRLVERHGGRIELESTAGSGSRFSVLLPMPAADAGLAGAPSGGVAIAPGDGPLVLVIEDDPRAAELLRLYLADAGHRVAVAPDGRTGLAEAERLAPAAIVLDILLPDVDGWEILQRLKRSDLTRDIPVLVVSIVDDAELGLALGAVDYFVKPVPRETLLTALGRLTFTTKVRQRPVRILVVDPEPEAGERFREALGPEGFAIITAATGAEGFERAQAAPPDLVFLALVLPDLDAFEVVARLKQAERTRDVPIWIVAPDGLTEADKQRLNGEVQGIVERGDLAVPAFHRWLERIASGTGQGDG